MSFQSLRVARILAAGAVLLAACSFGCRAKAPEPIAPGATAPNPGVPNANGKMGSPEMMRQQGAQPGGQVPK